MPRKPKYPDYPRINKQYKDRHHKHHYYVDGVAIHSRPFDSTAFRAEYERLVHSSTEDAAPRLGAIPGSFRWGCKQFMDATFAPDPKTATQYDRRLRLESMWDEVWKEGDPRVFGDYPLNRFEPKHILALVLRKKKFPHAANKRLIDVKMVFKWLKRKRLITDDPTADMDKSDKLPVPDTGGFYSWTDADREAYCAKHPPE